MRILGLCKRQYTGKDLLDDRYGRLFELPAGLSACGFDVNVVVTSYRPRAAINRIDAGVSWRSISLLSWYQTTTRLIKEWRPDVIWVSSDALHVIAGEYIGRQYGIPVVADLYDDYESFSLTRLPGLRGRYRRACRNVSALVAISNRLAATLRERMKDLPPVVIIGNGIPENFVPACSKEEARAILGLPDGKRLIGTAGALQASRGIGNLFAAWTIVHAKKPETMLVIAGPRDGAVPTPLPDGVIDLGILSHENVAHLFRALDVGVVCNLDSPFGNACHPQKLVEMVACGLPVVAADVGEVSLLLHDHLHARYPAENAERLAARICGQIDAPESLPRALAPRWEYLAKQLAEVLTEVVRDHTPTL